MSGTKTAPWVLGMAFLSVVVLAASWFLGVAPKLSAAAELDMASQAATSQIDTLEIQLAQLKRDYANIDSFRADLAALREQMPEGLDEPTLTRQIDLIATQTGAVVVTLSPGTPLSLAGVSASGVVPAPVAPAPAEEAAAEGTAEGTDIADASAGADATAQPDVPAGAVGVDGMWKLPLEIKLVGTYEQTVAFIDALQTLNPRLILVHSVSMNALDDGGATDGRPAVQAGWLETSVLASAFMVTPMLSSDEQAEDAAPVMPVPAGQPNPFFPAR